MEKAQGDFIPCSGRGHQQVPAELPSPALPACLGALGYREGEAVDGASTSCRATGIYTDTERIPSVLNKQESGRDGTGGVRGWHWCGTAGGMKECLGQRDGGTGLALLPFLCHRDHPEMPHFPGWREQQPGGTQPLWHRGGGGGGRGEFMNKREEARRGEGRTSLVQSSHVSSSGSSGHGSSLSRVMQPPPAPDPLINTVTS